LTLKALRELDGHDIAANVSSGTVTVYEHTVYLPVVARNVTMR